MGSAADRNEWTCSGFEALRAGQPMSACPHPEGSVARQEWMSGWETAALGAATDAAQSATIVAAMPYIIEALDQADFLAKTLQGKKLTPRDRQNIVAAVHALQAARAKVT